MKKLWTNPDVRKNRISTLQHTQSVITYYQKRKQEHNMNDKEKQKIKENNLNIARELYNKVENDLNSLESITDMARINIAIATAFNYANSKGIGSKMIRVIVDEMFELGKQE